MGVGQSGWAWWDSRWDKPCDGRKWLIMEITDFASSSGILANDCSGGEPDSLTA